MFVRASPFPVIAVLLCGLATGAAAQSVLDLGQEDEALGDIFVHPRDADFLPGQAPSRAELFKFSERYQEGRGDIARWEYRKGDTIITREVWIDQDGNKRGMIQIGPSF
jgi:hypothetical protein